MADIELLIKIDEEIYQHTQEYEVGGFNIENDTKLFIAIKNGIPLPKGHGRLIDADALKKDDEVTIWKTRDSSRTGKTLKFFSELFVRKIEDAPTIIEADKAESEEKNDILSKKTYR